MFTGPSHDKMLIILMNYVSLGIWPLFLRIIRGQLKLLGHLIKLFHMWLILEILQICLTRRGPVRPKHATTLYLPICLGMIWNP